MENAINSESNHRTVRSMRVLILMTKTKLRKRGLMNKFPIAGTTGTVKASPVRSRLFPSRAIGGVASHVAPAIVRHRSRRLGATATSFLLLVAGMAFSVSQPAGATGPAPLYVSSTSGSDSLTCGGAVSPCLTIQQAVTNASSGGIISVASGTYPEVVSINKALTLDGAQAGTTGSSHSGPE